MQRDGVELTLLGYLIDPDRPDATDRDILEYLIDGLDHPRELFGRTSRLGGRWVLIVDKDQETLLFNDPCGLRQVHYTTEDVPENWCTSQPALLQETLGLEVDPEALREFLASPFVQNTREYWWPGDSTRYREVRRLTPNHFLDLRNRAVSRFWPSEPNETLTLEEGTEQAANLLRKLMTSANRRFDLALAITAGLDSRTLLAAAKDIAPDVYFFTLTIYERTRRSPDVRIPAKLLAKLGLSHHVIESPPVITEAFAKPYRRNVSTAHDGWGTAAQAMYDHYPEEKVCVKGNGAEVARCSRYSSGIHPDHINGEMLAARAGMHGNVFATKHFSRWLEGAQKACDKCGYKLLDMFYWEQRMGSWQAMNQTEWDIVQEAFTPYNCRDLLTNLLAVDVKYRNRPRNELFHRIIQRLWTETLGEPVNPLPVSDKIVKTFRKAFGHAGRKSVVYKTSRKVFRTAKAALQDRKNSR